MNTFRRSYAIFRESLTILAKDKEILVFPLLSGIIMPDITRRSSRCAEVRDFSTIIFNPQSKRLARRCFIWSAM